MLGGVRIVPACHVGGFSLELYSIHLDKQVRDAQVLRGGGCGHVPGRDQINPGMQIMNVAVARIPTRQVKTFGQMDIHGAGRLDVLLNGRILEPSVDPELRFAARKLDLSNGPEAWK